MASTQEQELSQGYAFEFDPPLDKKHECPVCHLALRDPVQTACGHRFCIICVKEMLRKPRPRCPMDNEILNKDEVFPDNFCKREILNLTVLCKNRVNGCSWKGQLRELLDKHTTSCDYLVVICTNEGCSASVFQKDLQKHLQSDCEFRGIICDYCSQEFIFSQRKEHDAICPELEIDCENNCGQRLKRKDYEEHLKASCTCAELECEYASVGCPFTGPQDKLDIHQKMSEPKHLSLVFQSIKSLTAGGVVVRNGTKEGVVTVGGADKDQLPVNGLLSDDKITTREQFEHHEIEAAVKAEKDKIINELHQKIDHLTSRVEELTQTVIRLDSLCQDLSTIGSRTAALEQKHVSSQAKVTAVEHRLLAIEKSLAVKDDALAEHDVRLLTLEMTSYDGVLRWKITDYDRRQSEAIAGKRLSIYSPPFYTSRSGYKMCARTYLNGDGMGKGTHLSLFFVVMRGEYDALLPWPFQQRVTFTLIDQDHRRHVSDTFQPDPSSSSFQRPVNEMNVASGCPLFVPLEALKTQGYVKNDTLFIRVAVETKGLIHP